MVGRSSQDRVAGQATAPPGRGGLFDLIKRIPQTLKLEGEEYVCDYSSQPPREVVAGK